MSIDSKKLYQIPVRTQSDIFLGHVIGFELDPLQHRIESYYIKKAGFITPFFHKIESADYKIHFTQVLSVTSERMIVEDAVAKEEVLSKELSRENAESEPIA